MYDLIIIGNGMAGMTAALYAKRANLNFKIIGEDAYSGGQIDNAILIENFPCVEPVSGYELGERLRNQLENLGVEIEEVNVDSIYKESDNFFTVYYTDETFDRAKTIIYALGAEHRELSEICNVEGDVNIHHCAICDGALYKGKDVAIIGGGNTAFTEALYLSNIAATVTIITDKIIADEITVEKVRNSGNIRVYNGAKVDIIYKDNDINIVDFYMDNSKSHSESFDGIFSAIGMKPRSDLAPVNVKKDIYGYIVANEYGETNVAGFCAAGDIKHKMMRQALTAAADGANCVAAVQEHLRNN